MNVVTKHFRLIDRFPELAGKYAQKLHVKKEDIEYVEKIFISDLAEPESEAKAEKLKKERAIISYISTSTKDRDDEVIVPSGMKSDAFNNSGSAVFWGHNYSEPKYVIGQNQWIKASDDGEKLVAKTSFLNTQFADDVYKLYSEDFFGKGPVLRGFSIGFIPIDVEIPEQKGSDVPRKIYKEWELLEYSCVPLQSNREAVSIIEDAFDSGALKAKSLKKELLAAAVEEDKEETISITDEIEKEPDETIDISMVSQGEIDKDTITHVIESEAMGIEAIVGKLKSNPDGGYVTTTWMFDRDKWSLKDAEDWVDDNKEEVIMNYKEEDELQLTAIDGLLQELPIETCINGDIEFDSETFEKFLLEADDVNEAEEKRTDLKGNLSVWDIADAISAVIRKKNTKTKWYWVSDLYPVQYPNGHCVVHVSDKGVSQYFSYDYEIKDDKAVLDNEKELELSYSIKSWEGIFAPVEPQEADDKADLAEIKTMISEMKEGRTLSTANRKLVGNVLDILKSLMSDELKELVEELTKLYDSTGREVEVVTEEVEEEKEVEEEITITDEEKSEKELLVDAVKELLTKDKLSDIIEGLTQDALDKARGKLVTIKE